MLLFSAATPSDPDAVPLAGPHTPIILIEISHFLSSILGLVLVLLAFGLSRRLDAAWVATVLLLPVAAVLALIKGFDWEESSVLMASASLCCPFRRPSQARLGCREWR